MSVDVFASPHDFYKAVVGLPTLAAYDDREKWCSNESRAQSLERLREGDMTGLEEAQSLLTKIERQLDINRHQWEASVAGAYPMVPDFLAGYPENMRKRTVVADEIAPIRLYVCVTSSAGLKSSTLRRRGVALMALVMALCAERPTEAYALSTLDGETDGESLTAVRIPTEPLSLGHALWMLSSQGFGRRLNHAFSKHHHGFTGAWPRGFPINEDHNAAQIWAEKSGALARLAPGVPNARLISPAWLHDPLLSDPVSWLNTELARIRNADGAT